LWAVVVLSGGLVAAFGQVIEIHSKWDAQLLGLELSDVHISTNSLVDAWQAIQHQYLIRTVLVLDKEHSRNTPFAFDAARCTVSGLLEAFVAAYPDYTYTQDKQTGIIWLHPKALSYENILPAKVKLAKDALAIPMLSGVLDQLSQLSPLRVRSASRHSLSARGTFDYPVDLPQGIWSVRDIVNFCCVAHPGTMFYVSFSGDDTYDITPTTPASTFVHEISPTAIFFWQNEIGSTALGASTESDLVDALASVDARVRSEARKYCELCSPRISSDAVVRHAPPGEKALWTAVGMLSIHARVPGTTHLASLERIRRELENEGSSSNSPGIRALAAMELVRVAGYTLDVVKRQQALNHPVPDEIITRANGDSMAWERLVGIELSPASVSKVKYDMIRVLRYSKPVRDKLIELKVHWPGFSQADIEALGKTNIFSLP
jgi:hypothetical protein